MAVSQTITAISQWPQQGDSAFDAKSDAFVKQLATQTVSELNTAFAQINSTETNINNKEASATAAASTATQKASEASTSATNAANSATQAAASAASAAALYDNFDDRYLGAKASNPTTDNDGAALAAGALYWNTTVNEMRVWNGTAWQNQAMSDVSVLNAVKNVDGSGSGLNADLLDGLDSSQFARVDTVPTFVGGYTPSTTEGGEIHLKKPDVTDVLTGDVAVDIQDNNYRILANVTTGTDVINLPLKKKGTNRYIPTTHLTETVISVPGDFATIQEAINSLNTSISQNLGIYTIQLAAQTYTIANKLTLNNKNIILQIKGANLIGTTITSIGAVTGSAGAWSVPVNVASAAGMAVGGFVTLHHTTGTGDYKVVDGTWQITAISGNTITVTNKCRFATFPSITITGGTCSYHTTVLDCSTEPQYIALEVFASHSQVTFTNLLLKNGTVMNFYYTSHVKMNFTNVGIIAGNIYPGIHTSLNTAVNCRDGFLSITGENTGIYLNHNSIFYNYNGYIIVSGLLYDGLKVNTGSVFINEGTNYLVSCGNNTYGINSNNQSLVRLFGGNNYVTLNSLVDYNSIYDSCIFMVLYAGTPTFSPALNTVGNYNSIIIKP